MLHIQHDKCGEQCRERSPAVVVENPVPRLAGPVLRRRSASILPPVVETSAEVTFQGGRNASHDGLRYRPNDRAEAREMRRHDEAGSDECVYVQIIENVSVR